MDYIVVLVLLLFVLLGGLLFILIQVSEYALGQRPISKWVNQIPIAHRGLYDNLKIPENSLAAFTAAIGKGYAIELDVHLSQDEEVVVFHDHEFERATGQLGRITEVAYSQFQGYFLWGTSEQIPTLRQTLDLVQGKVPLFIEIKNAGKAGVLEQKVQKLLSAYAGPVIVISFNAKSLEWFRFHAPEILRGQNLPLEGFPSLSWYKICLLTLKHCRVSKPHVILYNSKKIPAAIVRFLTRFKPVIAYNVTTQASADSLKNVATNIIFDHFDPNINHLKSS